MKHEYSIQTENKFHQKRKKPFGIVYLNSKLLCQIASKKYLCI
jgi:hypothetical protein